MNNEIYWIIAAGAVLTFFTRIGGHWIFSRFEHVHPRVEAGLNAVPIAVLTALFAPAAINGGLIEWTCLAVALVITLTTGNFTVMFLTSSALLIVLRQIFT